MVQDNVNYKSSVDTSSSRPTSASSVRNAPVTPSPSGARARSGSSSSTTRGRGDSVRAPSAPVPALSHTASAAQFNIPPLYAELHGLPFHFKTQLNGNHEMYCFLSVPQKLHEKYGSPATLENVWNLAEEELMVEFFDLCNPKTDMSRLNVAGYLYEYEKRKKKHPTLFAATRSSKEVLDHAQVLKLQTARLKLLQTYSKYWNDRNSVHVPPEQQQPQDTASSSHGDRLHPRTASKKAELFGLNANVAADNKRPPSANMFPRSRKTKVIPLSELPLSTSEDLNGSSSTEPADNGFTRAASPSQMRAKQHARRSSKLGSNQSLVEFSSVDLSEVEKSYMTRSLEEARASEDYVEVTLNSRVSGRASLFVKLAPVVAESKVLQLLVDHGQFSINNDGFRCLFLSERSAEFAKHNTFGFLREENFRRFCAFANDPSLYERLESAETAWKRKNEEFQDVVLALRKELEALKKERLQELRRAREEQMKSVKAEMERLYEWDVKQLRQWYDDRLHFEEVELERKFMAARETVTNFCDCAKGTVDEYVSVSYAEELRTLERERNRVRDLAAHIFHEAELPRLALLAEGLRCENLLRACVDMIGKNFSKYRTSSELSSGMFRVETLHQMLCRVNDSLVVDMFQRRDVTFDFAIVENEYKMRRWFHQARYREMPLDELIHLLDETDESNEMEDVRLSMGQRSSVPMEAKRAMQLQKRETMIFRDLVAEEMESRRFMKSSVRVREDPVMIPRRRRSHYSGLGNTEAGRRKESSDSDRVILKLDDLEDEDDGENEEGATKKTAEWDLFLDEQDLLPETLESIPAIPRYDTFDDGYRILFTATDRYVTIHSDWCLKESSHAQSWERLYWEVKVLSQHDHGATTVIGFDVPRRWRELCDPRESRNLVIGRDGSNILLTDHVSHVHVERSVTQYGISWQSDGILHVFGRSRDACTKFGKGDVVGVGLDQREGTVTFYKNGVPVSVSGFQQFDSQQTMAELLRTTKRDEEHRKTTFNILPAKGYSLIPSATLYRIQRAVPTELQFNFAGPFAFLPQRHVAIGRGLIADDDVKTSK